MSQPFYLESNYDRKKPLLIYGFGQLCVNFLLGLYTESIEVTAIFDANPKYHNTKICGIPVLPPDRIGEFNRESNVFISTRQGKFTFTKLFSDLGFRNFYYSFKREMQCYDLLISKKEENRGIIDLHSENIQRARSLFKEQKSLDIFDARLNAHYNNDFIALERLYSTPTDFPKDIFSFTENEVFVDAGVWIGDSSCEFSNLVHGKYNFIHAFEPSEILAFVASRNFDLYNIKNIELHPYALYDREGAVSFDQDLTFQGLVAGRVSNTGSLTVPCTSLDIFFKTRGGGGLPSIIKMDIEGSEVAALSGARKIIGEAMPKLAICVYHKLEDLWEVPNKISEAQTGKGYDYHLRHQGSFYDTLLFASPIK